MESTANSSGIAISDARVSNFRSLKDIEVHLGGLTILMGANNAGKTSFLDALHAAIGGGKMDKDDIRLAPDEALPPKDRKVVIDIKIKPIADSGATAKSFPSGSYWTSLWKVNGILHDEGSDDEFMAFRTTLSWNEKKADYVIERKFLSEWRAYANWLETPPQDQELAVSQTEPIMFHYIDAKRDLDTDLRRQGSLWRRMTEDLGLSADDVIEMELGLSAINEQIVVKSEILSHLRANLGDMQNVVAGDSGGIDISPVARRLRDLSKSVDVSFSTCSLKDRPKSRHCRSMRKSIGAQQSTSWVSVLSGLTEPTTFPIYGWQTACGFHGTYLRMAKQALCVR